MIQLIQSIIHQVQLSNFMRQVLDWQAKGYSNAKIARILNESGKYEDVFSANDVKGFIHGIPLFGGPKPLWRIVIGSVIDWARPESEEEDPYDAVAEILQTEQTATQEFIAESNNAARIVKTIAPLTELRLGCYMLVKLLRPVDTALASYPTVTLLNVAERYVYGQASEVELARAVRTQMDDDDLFMHIGAIPSLQRYKIMQATEMLTAFL